MQYRRIWLKSLAIAALGWLPSQLTTAQQGTPVRQGRGAASLTDQLSKGLRAVTPEQFQFVNLVVARVDSGELPRGMVNLVYKWALKRNPRVPFPYFEYALKVLAERRGVRLG